jgi:S-layer homology domain
MRKYLTSIVLMIIVLLSLASQQATAQSPADPVATPTPNAATPTDCPNPFVDISGNIFYGAIHYLYCAGVISGTDATHFSPAANVTRGQFAKLLVTGFHEPFYTPTSGQDFTDVPPDYFGYLYIESGFHAGILSGFDAANCTAHGQTYPCYLPNTAITRGQLARLIFNAAGYIPATTIPHCFAGSTGNYQAILDTLCAKGVIHGYPDGTFRPNNPIRRDEAAQILYKAMTTP